MRKNIIILISIFLIFNSSILSHADYFAPELFDMVGASDLVLLGTIIDVKEETFLLKIDDILCGKYVGNIIEIYKYKDWICSIRWSGYEKGQKEIVFLNKNNNRNQNKKGLIYTLRSAGSEGEWPIIDNCVYCPYVFMGIPFDTYGKNSFQKLDLDIFLSAIKEYSKCYQLIRVKSTWPVFDNIKQICTDEELIKYEWKSIIHRHLSETTKIRLKYYINK